MAEKRRRQYDPVVEAFTSLLRLSIFKNCMKLR